jgi:hypothetical protein
VLVVVPTGGPIEIHRIKYSDDEPRCPFCGAPLDLVPDKPEGGAA